MSKEFTVDTSKTYWVLMHPFRSVPGFPTLNWTDSNSAPDWIPCIIESVSYKSDIISLTLRILGTHNANYEKEYTLETFQELIKVGKIIEDKGYHLEQIVTNDYLAPGVSIRTTGWIVSD